MRQHRESKYIIKKTLFLARIVALIITSFFCGSAIAAEKRLCDALENCLASAQAAKYRQAEAHISIENWQAANDMLGQLYVESLQSEASINFLVVNNYAVTLAKTGRPAVAALVLEKFFKDLPGIGPGFQNLMQTYEFLAASAEPGVTPAVDLLLIDPGPSPGRQVTEAAPRPTEDIALITEYRDLEISAVLRENIAKQLDQYLNTWRAGDIATYLSFYTPGHSPINAMGYEEWQLQRRSRVRPDRAIKVSISDLQIRHKADGQVTSEFTQNYQSRYYSDTSRKKLSWIQNIDGNWTIHHEVSLL
ncbi:MAG: hypothetical protein ACJAVI_004613 [Candidatus Azotimanducaceae bacterium]